MPQRGFHCIVDFEDVSFDACIRCAATLGRCHLTASLLRGMADQAQARETAEAPTLEGPGDGDGRTGGIALPVVQAAPIPKLSVTTLVGCVRQAYLKTTEEYYQRPDQQYWSYRGTLAHLLVERGAGAGMVSEQRFERELRLPSGRVVTITGQPDEIDPARSLLTDYKTTDRPPKTPSPMHIAQLNVYRWLVTPRYEIERLGIVYLTMRAVRKVAVPIWPAGQVERFLYERAGALAEAFDTGAWPGLTEDRWLCTYCPVAAACERGPDVGAPAGDPAALAASAAPAEPEVVPEPPEDADIGPVALAPPQRA